MQIKCDAYLLVVAEDGVVVPCLCGLRQLAASAQVQQHDSCQPSCQSSCQLTGPSHPAPPATFGSHHSHSHSTNYAHVKSSKQKIPEKRGKMYKSRYHKLRNASCTYVSI
jgi:hypothetical protein